MKNWRAKRRVFALGFQRAKQVNDWFGEASKYFLALDVLGKKRAKVALQLCAGFLENDQFPATICYHSSEWTPYRSRT